MAADGILSMHMGLTPNRKMTPTSKSFNALSELYLLLQFRRALRASPGAGKLLQSGEHCAGHAQASFACLLRAIFHFMQSSEQLASKYMLLSFHHQGHQISQVGMAIRQQLVLLKADPFVAKSHFHGSRHIQTHLTVCCR